MCIYIYIYIYVYSNYTIYVLLCIIYIYIYILIKAFAVPESYGKQVWAVCGKAELWLIPFQGAPIRYSGEIMTKSC